MPEVTRKQIPIRHGGYNYLFQPKPRKQHRSKVVGQPRCTRNFKNSAKRKFVDRVVRLLGARNEFKRLVKTYTQRCCPLYHAYAMALRDISQRERAYGSE